MDYYGSPTQLQQLASFATPTTRTLLITPYDVSALRAIERALSDSEVGANPSNDGKVIRVIMPELTQDRRKEYVKIVKTKVRTLRFPSATSAARPRMPWTAWSRTARLAKTTAPAPKRTWTPNQGPHDAIDDLLKRKEAELLEV
ncbi:ribosome recycling factor [Arthrobacter citreus]